MWLLCVMGPLLCFTTKIDSFLVLPAHGRGEPILAPEALQAQLCLPARPGFVMAAELPGPSLIS